MHPSPSQQNSKKSLAVHPTIALLLPSPTPPTAAAEHPYHTIDSLSYHCNTGWLIPPLIQRRGLIIHRYYDDNNNEHIIVVRRIRPPPINTIKQGTLQYMSR